MVKLNEKRILELIEAGGFSMRSASLKADLGETFVRDALKRGRVPSIDNLAALAKALGTNVNDLLEDEPVRELIRVPLEVWDPASPDAGAPEPGFAAGAPYEPKTAGARPEIDVTPGAGEGAIGEHVAVTIESGGTVTGHRVIAEWLFPIEYLRSELKASHAGTLVLEVKGDSMRPTLEPGDRIIVDTRQNAFGPDAVYVIDDGDGEPRVKRLEKILFSSPAAVLVVSDNPAHGSSQADLDRLRVLGRVVGRVSRM